MAKRAARRGGMSEATPRRARTSDCSGYILVYPDGSLLTSTTGKGMADDATLARVKAGTDVQTPKGLLTYNA